VVSAEEIAAARGCCRINRRTLEHSARPGGVNTGDRRPQLWGVGEAHCPRAWTVTGDGIYFGARNAGPPRSQRPSKHEVISLHPAIERNGAMTTSRIPHLRFAGKAICCRDLAVDLCRRSEQGRGSYRPRKLRPRVCLRESVRARSSSARHGGKTVFFGKCDQPAKRPASRAAKT